jgi:hypothetical protein
MNSLFSFITGLALLLSTITSNGIAAVKAKYVASSHTTQIPNIKYDIQDTKPIKIKSLLILYRIAVSTEKYNSLL